MRVPFCTTIRELIKKKRRLTVTCRTVGDRRHRERDPSMSILSSIACCPLPSTVNDYIAVTNITLGAQCIGFYEYPPRKRRNTRWWNRFTVRRGAGRRARKTTMERTQILLRYFVNATNEEREKERRKWPTCLSNVRPRKILCPSVRKRAMKSFYAFSPRPAMPLSICRISPMHLFRRLILASSRFKRY